MCGERERLEPDLLKAVLRWHRAKEEFRRARNACEQPRLTNAGSRLYLAEAHLRGFALQALRARAEAQQ